MRSAAVCIRSSMHALMASVAGTAAGATAGSTGAASFVTTACRSNGSMAAAVTATAQLHQRQRKGQGPCCAGASGFLLRSDASRQRRLIAAAAAAQPCPVEHQEDTASQVPWPGMNPGLEPIGADAAPDERQQQQQQRGIAELQQGVEEPAPQRRRRGRPPKTGPHAQQASSQAATALPAPPGVADLPPPGEQVDRPGHAACSAQISPQPQEPQHLQQQPPAETAGRAAWQHAEAPFRLPVPNLGYTCLNIELQQQGIRTNRSCRRRTFESEGLSHVSALALANCQDLLALVEWNARQGIHFFRIPSALFPWDAEYELEQLPDWEEIAATLAVVGAAARLHRQRLTAHPSHFVQLATPDESLRARSLRHLEHNSRVFDLMGYAPSPENKINIHIGGLYGCKRAALNRFAASLDMLSPACRTRITVENDDRPRWFSIADLLPLHAMAGTPLVFDFLHHSLVPGGLSEEEAVCAALDTWPAGVRPVVHYSESSEDPLLARRAHSFMLTQPFELYGREADVDVMLEAKGMERALLFYRDALQLGRKTRTEVPPSKPRRPGQ